MARIVIQFNIKSLLENALIKKATLSLYRYGTMPDSMQVPNEVLKSTTSLFLLKTIWNANETNWTKPWSIAGGDFDQGNPIQTKKNTLKPPKDWHAYDVTKQIISMHNGSIPNTGFIFVPSKAGQTIPDFTGDFYYSSEYSNTTLRPKLDITYELETKTEQFISQKFSQSLVSVTNLSKKLKIEFFAGSRAIISLYSLHGKILLNKNIDKCKNSSFQIPTKKLSNGMHIVSIKLHQANSTQPISIMKKCIIK